MLACEETFTPSGIYAYQVENLLADFGSKQWTDLTSEPKCDSLHILLDFTFTSEGDSLVVSEFLPTCEMTLYDTILVGTAYASRNDLIFTDSLKFDDGTHWIINKIRSNELIIDKSGSIFSYSD